jgi:hypothetical protein
MVEAMLGKFTSSDIDPGEDRFEESARGEKYKLRARNVDHY